MNVLGIETSCDETAIAVYSAERGLLSHELYSQIKLHNEYGGVVPELASRDHVRKIMPLINQAIKKAGIAKQDLTGIAYTQGPGLIGALLVGASVAKSLAFGLNIPAIGVHHLEAHIMAALLEDNPPVYPFLTLLVSGGHCLLIEVKAFGDYRILGETVDDAAGEAFDKTAKLLGLPYPGGREIAELAKKGNEHRFTLPKPMVNRPGLDFSFSGLKTHVARLYAEHKDDPSTPADLAAGFQATVVDTLLIKCQRALKQTGLKRLVIAGGVSANQRLRQQCQAVLAKEGVTVFFPRPAFCTDNGAMVAYTGFLRLQAGFSDSRLAIVAKARWPIANIDA